MKEITSKRTKTDDDLDALARVEWEGGLYLDQDGDVSIPSYNLLALGKEGAKKFKLGKLFSAGVFSNEMSFKLDHLGPKDLDALYEADNGAYCDERPARVGQNMVMRHRPFFRDWGIEFELMVDDTVIEIEDVERCYREAGRVVGCLEMRPSHGRYTVEKFDISEVNHG